jgi:SAM-dependent methyltransferase
MASADPRPYVARNRRRWDGRPDDIAAGRRQWTRSPSWGIWDVPDSELGLLTPFAGADAVELGCGTAYVSAWLARQGSRPIGIDLSGVQLATARRLQREFDVHFPLVHAAAERVPLRAGAFDLAVSEYGAAIWSDPYRWIPEAARLLRPGGELIFLGNAMLLVLCQFDSDDVPADRTLKRPYFGMHRVEWPDDPGVEFQLGIGDWIRLLRTNGFTVEDLIEVRPVEGATTRYSFVEYEWARQFPSEQIWRARKL